MTEYPLSGDAIMYDFPYPGGSIPTNSIFRALCFDQEKLRISFIRWEDINMTYKSSGYNRSKRYFVYGAYVFSNQLKLRNFQPGERKEAMQYAQSIAIEERTVPERYKKDPLSIMNPHMFKKPSLITNPIMGSLSPTRIDNDYPPDYYSEYYGSNWMSHQTYVNKPQEPEEYEYII